MEIFAFVVLGVLVCVIIILIVVNSVPTIYITHFINQGSYVPVKYTYNVPSDIINRENYILNESFQIIRKSKNIRTIISRYNLIVSIYYEFEQYQAKGMISPIDKSYDFNTTIKILSNKREAYLKEIIFERLNKADNRLYSLKTYKAKINTATKLVDNIKNLFDEKTLLPIDLDFVFLKINECMQRHNLPAIQKHDIISIHFDDKT